MKFAIYEGNMEKLVKKLNTIQRKCRKYGCDFKFAEVGEEYREREVDKVKEVNRFVILEVEGIAKVNDWEFVASIDHTDNGNIIRSIGNIEIPNRFYHTDCRCEHCKTNRARKYICVVHNTVTDEFKQVGKQCLKDFTNGLDAEHVTALMDGLVELEKAEDFGYGSGYSVPYRRTADYLRCVVETVNLLGFAPSSSYEATHSFAWDAMRVEEGSCDRYLQTTKEKMEKIGFNSDRKENSEAVAEMLSWVAEQDGESDNYMHNLKTACTDEWMSAKHTGIVASLVPTYNKAMERETKRRQFAKQAEASKHVGEVGKRITVDIAEAKILTSWESYYGYNSQINYLWQIVDTDGNIYTWKTSNTIPSEAKKLTGTIKAHKEYKGAKQTELTRCKTA